MVGANVFVNGHMDRLSTIALLNSYCTCIIYIRIQAESEQALKGCICFDCRLFDK